MNVERELIAAKRRLKDLQTRQQAIQMRCWVRDHDEPYPPEARDGDLIITIEPPLDWN